MAPAAYFGALARTERHQRNNATLKLHVVWRGPVSVHLRVLASHAIVHYGTCGYRPGTVWFRMLCCAVQSDACGYQWVPAGTVRHAVWWDKVVSSLLSADRVCMPALFVLVREVVSVGCAI